MNDKNSPKIIEIMRNIKPGEFFGLQINTKACELIYIRNLLICKE